MAENTEINKRKYPRLNIVCPCIVRVGSRDFHGIIRNISRGGLSLESANELSEKTSYQISFVLPEGPQIATTGRIHWSMPQGNIFVYGLEFESLGFFKKISLNSYINKGISKSGLTQNII